MTVEPTTATQTTPRRRIPADTFANRLLLARRLAGTSIEDAAGACRLNKSSWANWENGKRPQRLVEVCEVISEKLNVDFDWLLLGGPLEGSRGRPTNRSGSDTDWYPTSDLEDAFGYRPYASPTDRPMAPVGHPANVRPKGREDRTRPMSPSPIGRRAALVR
jgi:transcriptional regulator with XRE-family HTH domain